MSSFRQNPTFTFPWRKNTFGRCTGTPSICLLYTSSPVFWSYVGRQLLLGKEEARWVVGRLTKSGQAFRLESPTEEENGLFAKVLSQVDES